MLHPVGREHVHAAVGQAIFQFFHQRAAVRAGLIHLVDEQKRGHMVALQQAPQRGGVPLHAVSGADNQYRAIQHAQGALGFARKIHVAGGIHQGDGASLPGKLRLLGKNGDAALTLLNVGIQKGVAMIHAPQPAQRAALIQHGLGQGGLARVHMRQQTHGQAAAHACSSFCRASLRLQIRR